MHTITSRISILFLPGLICDSRIWRDQVQAFSGADPVVADFTTDDDIGTMAERALAVAPDKFALVGLSMGGYVAFEIIRRAQHRVTALALFDTNAAPETLERARRRRADMESLELGKFVGVTRKLLPQLVHPAHVDGPVGIELQAMALRLGRETFLRQQRAILGRPDSRPLLGGISVPSLVAVGDGDVLTPPINSLDIHIGIPASEFVVIRDCGHLPSVEQPERVTSILRTFLKLPLV